MLSSRPQKHTFRALNSTDQRYMSTASHMHVATTHSCLAALCLPTGMADWNAGRSCVANKQIKMQTVSQVQIFGKCAFTDYSNALAAMVWVGLPVQTQGMLLEGASSDEHHTLCLYH